MIKVIKQMATEAREFLLKYRWEVTAYLIVAFMLTNFFSSLAEEDEKTIRHNQRLRASGVYLSLDKCLYREAMESCLIKLPDGAKSLSATGSDWDEVVEVCENYADRFASRLYKNIKEQCK